MKKLVLFSFSLVLFMIVLQGCPCHNCPPESKDEINCFLSNDDTINITSINYIDGSKFTQVFNPSDYVQYIAWVSLEGTQYKDCDNKLYIQKSTNHGITYYILTELLYVNGEMTSIRALFNNIKDSTIVTTNEDGTTETSVVRINNNKYDFQELVKQFQSKYPNYILCLNDTNIHVVRPVKFHLDKEPKYPSITLTEKQ